jgi:capsular polysaccharide export protein
MQDRHLVDSAIAPDIPVHPLAVCGRETPMPQPTAGHGRSFLFLQGPHGPFFRQLGAALNATGAKVWRAGFNQGDQAFWPAETYLGHKTGDWPQRLELILTEKGITDLVLYGDTRPVHAHAVAHARARGVTVHVFEEGYLRPYWVTYERGGSNGHSRLMQMTLPDLLARHPDLVSGVAEVPPVWGDMRQHMFWGAIYHGLVLAGSRRYPAFRPHRGLTVGQEFGLYLRRFLMLPLHRWERMLATRRIARGRFPYHLVLLQLEHDASFLAHSQFRRMTDFLALVIEGFATGAPPHHHLVFKAHPLEDGRAPIADDIDRLARQHNLQSRIHFVRGGKLAQLLDTAETAVTVNSTAGQQALWRGLPLRIFGDAVYGKPEFVSTQNLADFFAAPRAPDLAAYRAFRAYLLATSQIPGGFYSAAGRKRLLRGVVDKVLSDRDPYDALSDPNAAQRQQLRIVV